MTNRISMNKPIWAGLSILLATTVLGMMAYGQFQPGEPPPFPPDGQPPFGPRGRGGPGGPGGFMKQERKLVEQFDRDANGWLNSEERQAARKAVGQGRGGRGRGGFGPPGFGGRGPGNPPAPGVRLTPADVKSHPDAELYDPSVLRTLFIEFENREWEAELADFKDTDVEVPVTLTVDGKKYANVGVHFRGMSSYMMVPAGSKRSLNLSMDFIDSKQRLYGYKTLNLLNANGDPSLMSTVLYSHIARKHVPAPKANFVRVVINGEDWGVYTSVQQFNKEFLAENYRTDKGARWKVPGSPGGGGGLDYLGEDVENYKRRYEIKSKDTEKSWRALVNLCKTLNETPVDKLEEALEPILDVDGLLWFLALDITLINSDGYWTRASDFNIYLDEKGKFHIIPHDMNEAFRPGFGGPGGPGGPGGFFGPPPRPGEILPPPLQEMLQLSDEQKRQLERLQKETDDRLAKILSDEQNRQIRDMRARGPGGFGPPPGDFGPDRRGPDGPRGRGRGPGGPGFGGGGGGIELDPLTGLTDPRKPLRSKVLAVPRLREKYLQHVRTIASEDLNWQKLGSFVAGQRQLIEKEVEADTKKLSTFDDFLRATADDDAQAGPRGRGMSLRAFAEQRARYLLNHPEIKKLAASEKKEGK